MKSNFVEGIIAIANETQIFLGTFIHNKTLSGFIVGAFITILIAGFIITKNPKNIPIILKYSPMDGFQKIASSDTSGTYQLAYSTYTKMYTEVRMLFGIAFISVCVMITTILLTRGH